MLIACWSAKGGSGTTVVAAGLALVLSSRSPGSTVVADLAGDIPAVLGRPEPAGPGLAEWSRAAEVGPEALGRLVDRSDPRLGVLARGDGPIDGSRLAEGLARLGRGDETVVVDCGVVGRAGAGPESDGAEVAGAATVSLLVTRNCYLALHRAVRAPLRPSAVVLLEEGQRALGPRDVSEVLGVPVTAIVPIDEAIARAVDSGLLGTRLPRRLTQALQAAA